MLEVGVGLRVQVILGRAAIVIDPEGAMMLRLHVLWLAAVVAGALPHIAAGEECLTNPSFEQWDDSQPADWTRQSGQAAPADGQGRSGARALRLSAVQARARLYRKQAVALRPSTHYIASVWAKGKGQLALTFYAWDNKGWRAGMSSHRAELTNKWRRYQFAYGTRPDDALRARFGIGLTGQGAYALLDDASLAPAALSAAASTNLAPNGNANVDADNDGRPDTWRFPACAAAESAKGPGGSPAAFYRYADKAPKGAAAFDPGAWWQWDKQQGGAPTWVEALSSKLIPIEPGHTYRISYVTRGDSVRGYHVKLFWMRDAKRLLRWRTLGPKRAGRWNWERVSITLTAPPADVSGMRIAFWCLAGGGRIWVDDLTVNLLSVAPVAAYTDVAKVQAVPDAEPLPAEAPLPDITYSRSCAGAPGVREADSSRVRVDADAVRIHLATGVTLVLPRHGDALLGVTEVKLGDLPLRNASAPPIAPVLDVRGGRSYTKCRLVGAELKDKRDVVVHSLLIHPAGRDKLDWIFKPMRRRVAGDTYVGFAYQYVIEAGRAQIDQVMDRATWELGGQPAGVAVIDHNGYKIDNVFHLTADDRYCTGGGVRFATGEGIEYQMAAAGALAYYYDDPIPFVRANRFGARQWIVYRDAVQYAGAARLTTPLKCVLFCPRAGHDDYTWLRDDVYRRQAQFYGIRSAAPKTMANCWLSWWETPKKDGKLHYEKLLYDFADKVAPAVGDMNFQVFALHSIWGRGGCSLDRVEVGEKFGGDAALKALCDAAKSHGMIVQVWSTTAHLWQHAPLYTQHPNWHIQGPDGKPPTTYCYPEIRGVGFAEGWADYALGQLKLVRERTGLGSLWLDSYASFTHCIRCANRKFAMRQARELFKYHGKLSQLGYELYTEATGAFGVPACGFPVGGLGSALPQLPDPYTRYGLSGYMGAAGTPRKEPLATARVRAICDGNYYYRLLANKATVQLYWSRFAEMKDVHAKIASANRDYRNALDDMQFRHTLRGGRGVEWTNARNPGRVLFTFKKHRHQERRLIRAADITNGRKAPIESGGFMAYPCHTYRLAFEK